ncbi:MAG: hypothetical protein JOY54_08945 [Acidobacteriaceae bacterium]|nr:hypothetical protein [Acidobacteriaceae bacterium]
MPFFGKFELLEPIRIDVEETWLARESGSGRILLLHKFLPASGIRERLLTMQPDDLIMLVTAGEENGVCFVATYDTPELRDFRQWVDQRSKQPAPAPLKTSPSTEQQFDGARTLLRRPPVTDPQRDVPTEIRHSTSAERSSSPEPGEVTRMFQAPAGSSAVPPEPPVTPPQRLADPGEFTRAFNASPSTPAARHVLHDPSVSPQQPSGPGEFTRMFQAPASPGATPEPQRPTSPQNPAEQGEFTRMFQGPASPGAAPEPQRPTSPQRPAEQGEFTRMFQAPASPGAAPESQRPTGPQRPAEQGEFTRMFQAPVGAAPPPNPPLGASPQRPAETGEFTRMFQPPPTPAPAVPPNLQRPASPQRPVEPGDFTKFFSNPLPSSPLADRLDKPGVESPVPAAPRLPGEFTRTFGRPDLPAVPPPSSPVFGVNPALDQGATGLFSRPQSSTPLQPAPSSGPGEYTRIFSNAAGSNAAGAAPPQPAAPQVPKAEDKPQPATPASAQPASKYLPLVIILAVLGMVATALVMYFLMRR